MVFIPPAMYTLTLRNAAVLCVTSERENLHPIVNQRPFICAENPQRKSMSFPTGKTQGKCQLGTKQQMWHLSLEKKGKEKEN